MASITPAEAEAYFKRWDLVKIVNRRIAAARVAALQKKENAG
jgi:hypothetical protein